MAAVDFSSKPVQPYLINVGDADKMRATALNLIFDPHSIGFFPFDKLKNGDKILFAGCGNGQLVVEIAKELRRRNLSVEIVALDISQQQLDCARLFAEQENIQDINWKLQDVHNLQDFKGQFNFVHARFLLNHLSDAKLVTEMLCDTLSEDGIFIGEEFDGIDVDVLPESGEYRKAIDAWVDGIKLQHALQKSDMAFAKHLPAILKNINMAVTRELQPNPLAESKEQKNVFPECMASAHRIFPADKHHTIPIIKAALENVRDSKECSISFKHFTQIEAKKRAKMVGDDQALNVSEKDHRIISEERKAVLELSRFINGCDITWRFASWESLAQILDRCIPQQIEELKTALGLSLLKAIRYDELCANKWDALREGLGLTRAKLTAFYSEECSKIPFLGNEGFYVKYGSWQIFRLQIYDALLTPDMRNKVKQELLDQGSLRPARELLALGALLQNLNISQTIFEKRWAGKELGDIFHDPNEVDLLIGAHNRKLVDIRASIIAKTEGLPFWHILFIYPKIMNFLRLTDRGADGKTLLERGKKSIREFLTERGKAVFMMGKSDVTWDKLLQFPQFFSPNISTELQKLNQAIREAKEKDHDRLIADFIKVAIPD